MKEKRLTFNNIREMLLDLLKNAKDKNGYDFDIRHTHDKEDYERIFFKNEYSDSIVITENLKCCLIKGIPNQYEELFEAALYSEKDKYEIYIDIQLTSEWILFIHLSSKSKNNIMHPLKKPDKNSVNEVNLFRQCIRHPKTRELIDLLYEKILVPELTENGGNRNGREKSFSFKGRDEELRSSLYN